MPTQEGVSKDWRPAHKAVPHVVPHSDPMMFAGSCSAGDFRSDQVHSTEAAAVADVAEHVAAQSA